MDYTCISGGKTYPASAYQSAVFECVRAGRGSVNVIAVAGSGKTTTAVNCLAHVPPRAHVRFFAFNVAVARKLKVDVAAMAATLGVDGRNWSSGTFHSVGVGAVAKKLGKRVDGLDIDSGKCRKLLKEHLSEEHIAVYGSFVTRLVGYAKGEGIGCLAPDTEDRWYDLVEHHGMYLDSDDATVEQAVGYARSLLRWSNEASITGRIDYDDMLYLPVLWKLRLWQNDFVFVDEAQDTNPVRRAIARLALKPGGRLLAFGDPKQSIYGFTGASVDAMELIKRDFKATELPLTVSYRCARAVVTKAQTWVDYIEAHDGAPEGSVKDGVPLDEALDVLSARDAVLCRQRAPLVKLAYSIIARGRACRILGRDIGEGLIDLIKVMRARGLDQLLIKLAAFREREMARFIAKGDEPAAESVDDRVTCLEIIVQNLDENSRTIPALIRRIESLFKDDGSTVLTLCTVHKAKGLEWETVAILEPQLMPSKAARTDWQYEQEINLQYVAATRAQRTLLYLAPME